MQQQPDQRCWILCPDAVSTVLTDGAVILDLRSKFFFSANLSGWAIIQMFEAGTSRAEVHAATRSWGAGPGDVPAIDAFIDQLLAEKLVETGGTPSTAVPATGMASWVAPTLSKHREPLQRIMVSAFDPGLPLAE